MKFFWTLKNRYKKTYLSPEHLTDVSFNRSALMSVVLPKMFLVSLEIYSTFSIGINTIKTHIFKWSEFFKRPVLKNPPLLFTSLFLKTAAPTYPQNKTHTNIHTLQLNSFIYNQNKSTSFLLKANQWFIGLWLLGVKPNKIKGLSKMIIKREARVIVIYMKWLVKFSDKKVDWKRNETSD